MEEVGSRLRWTLGPGVVLRPVGPGDVEDLYRAVSASREHLRGWLPWVDTVHSVTDVARFVHGAIEQRARNDGFHAALRVDGSLVGEIGFHGIDWMNGSTSIGYWLTREAEGRGLMTKACAVLVEHALGELGLHRVEIRCEVENERSRAVPRRLGFREEGTLRGASRIRGRFVDVAVYGLLADEWARERSRHL